jgi:ABC-2 type transport system permease protein
LTASLLSLIGTLPILAIHLWISFAFGIGASVGVGILGILVAVLMGTTNLGNNIWYFLPWTYPVKMSMFPLALLAPSSQMIANKIIIQFILCISLSLVLSILFLLFGIIWFEKWEGRKNVE